MTESPVRFALIGAGRIAQRHAQHIQTVGCLEAVCDTDVARAAQLASSYNARHYSSVQELLSSETDIDVASICTPNGLHADHSILALRAGCHVLCEKPMATTVDDCGRMIQEAERNNRRLFVVKQNRFNPPVVTVKQLLDQGRLGRILSVQLNCFWNRDARYYDSDPWKGTSDLDGGCLFTQFSHFVDLLYWLIGDVSAVAGFADNFVHERLVDFEDCGVVALRFRSGALGAIHFTINSFAKNMEGSLTIFGERGTVKIGGQYLNELEYHCIENYEIRDLAPGRPANQYGHYVGSMSNHDQVYENVVDVLRNNGVIATNGYEGLKTVEIIEKIYGAMRFAPRGPSKRLASRLLVDN